MPIPEHVAWLRSHVGAAELWFPGVTAVIRRRRPSGRPGEVEVLLVRRADSGAWTPVTGIVDPGEEPARAAVREAREETGVEIRVDRLAGVLGAHRVVHPNGDRSVYLDHTFACTWLSGEPHVADDESIDVRWCAVADLGALDPPMGADMRERIDAGVSDEVAARFLA